MFLNQHNDRTYITWDIEKISREDQTRAERRWSDRSGLYWIRLKALMRRSSGRGSPVANRQPDRELGYTVLSIQLETLDDSSSWSVLLKGNRRDFSSLWRSGLHDFDINSANHFKTVIIKYIANVSASAITIYCSIFFKWLFFRSWTVFFIVNMSFISTIGETIGFLLISLIVIIEGIVKVFIPNKYKMKSVAGEIALVTGGGGGLGRLLSLRLANLGVIVVVWDINKNGEFSIR